MIINLRGKVTNNGVLDFEIPMLFLPNPSFIAVTQLWISFKTKVRDVSGTITSSLVNKSPINADQQILFFYQRENSRTIHYSPNHLALYKVQCHGLHYSVFEISCSAEDGNKPKIDEVFLQLSVTDARF